MPGRQLVDEAELAVVVAGAHLVEQRRVHLDAERLAGPLVDLDGELEPAAARRRARRSASSVEELPLDDVAGHVAVDRDDLVADLDARRRRPGSRARRRRLEVRTWRQGYGLRPPRPAPAAPVAVNRRWRSTACSSPRPAGSAPAWRWRSRRWRGWCGRSSRPCTATTRSSTTSSSSTASSDLGVVFVDDIAEVPDGRAAHAVGPRLGPRGRRRGPGQRRLRRRRGVPARHQGAPRGEGPGRQGLPHRLRRPRGPRGGGRHDGRRARRDPPGRVGRRGRRAARRSTSRSRCSPRRRCRTATGPACSTPTRRALPRRVDARAQRPVLRHHQPPVGADGDRRRAATRSS